jgi:hypothetical protein
LGLFSTVFAVEPVGQKEVTKTDGPIGQFEGYFFFKFFYIFLKSFCKNRRWFENVTLLTSIRRCPRRRPWPTVVSALTTVGHDG